ncbi:hypothetical protein SDC9_197945 [bioreactor metagenome]|uniref:Uncharacterized protein n=1 Tax=bioreactor metagenome TaxID=1076179 RepID=A0A645IIL3_9ZZZZ
MGIGDEGGDELYLLLIAFGKSIEAAFQCIGHFHASGPVFGGCFGRGFAHAFKHTKVDELFENDLFGVKTAFFGQVANGDFLAIDGLTIE